MIGYDGIDLGLTNQKIALIGLIHRARRLETGLVLPPFFSYNVGRDSGGKYQFEDVFSRQSIISVLDAFSIRYAFDEPYEPTDAWSCFLEGAGRFGEAGVHGPAALSDLTCQIVKGLVPNPKVIALSENIITTIKDLRIDTAIQMRIEKDWEGYSDNVLSAQIGSDEEQNLSFADIMLKVQSTFGDRVRAAYVLCDESVLPRPKEEIRDYAKEHFDIALYWKSDILSDIRESSSLVQSMIDFDVAKSARIFVGNSRSTFSCFVGFEKFCKQQAVLCGHYIYNVAGPVIPERRDNGSNVDPAIAMDPINARSPLIARAANDIAFPYRLHAHISNIGEFTSVAFMVKHIPSGDLVVGDATDNAERHIEGFTIFADESCPELEYRALLGAGQWTDWSSPGSFVGTRGAWTPVFGFAIHLLGPPSLSLDCVYAGKFKGHADIVTAHNGEDCVFHEPSALQAMQMTFRRKVERVDER